MSRARCLALPIAAVLVGAALRAQGAPVPLLPSTPHRVLQVAGDPASYYLVEGEQTLTVACDGPGLLTLKVRRAILEGDPPVAPSSVRLALDGDVKPPLVFRRAREEGAAFAGETRFFPSAPRTTRLAIPGGSHLLRIDLGQQTPAVAVALTLTPALARAAAPVFNTDRGPGTVRGRPRGESVPAANEVFNHFDDVGGSRPAGQRPVL
ncbi:MAG: hypothetical protein JXR83_04140 [Deltaproteobacteria bacterium]|nr:hypothetical protein [Deltaproteobacteria bacterium]